MRGRAAAYTSSARITSHAFCDAEDALAAVNVRPQAGRIVIRPEQAVRAGAREKDWREYGGAACSRGEGWRQYLGRAKTAEMPD